MKLTTRSEYSLLALIYMARHEKEGFVKIESICSKHDIDKKYLEQLFSILKRSYLIKTKRGSQGGYRLGKSANKISVATITRIMDGALAPTESVSKYFFNATSISHEKKILKAFREIRDYTADKLEKITLADLI